MRKLISRAVWRAMASPLSVYRKSLKFFGTGLLVTLLLATTALFLIERAAGNDVTPIDMFWTAVFTLFSAGDFADRHPVSQAGKIIIFILSLLGIGIVGWLVAELTGNFILKKLKEALGMGKSHFKDHLVVLGWNTHAHTAIDQLQRGGFRGPLVVVAARDEDPLADFDGPKVFIRGDLFHGEINNILDHAGIAEASVALILAENPDGRPKDDVDARTILTSLAIAAKNSDICTIAEILEPRNAVHARNARVDEIILFDDIAAKLLANCALAGRNTVVYKILDELLTVGEGFSFKVETVPPELAGKSFDEAIAFFRRQGKLPLAILDDTSARINPPTNTTLTVSDKLFIISP